MVTYRRSSNWTKANNYTHLVQPRQISKWKVCEGLASTVHFVVTMENKIAYNKYMVPRVSQILTKTKYFLLNQNLTCANYGICCM